jgi:two-component system chemotaxis sensor kinase CheA
MASGPVDDDLSEIIGEFLVESRENLDQLDNTLVDLEQDPTNSASLGSVFRTLHTIKGASGFLGFGHLESVSHAAEDLLSRLRDGAIVLNPTMTSGLLAAVDAIREMLAVIEVEGSEGDRDDRALVERLRRLKDGSAEVAAPAVVPVPMPGPGAPASPPLVPAAPPSRAGKRRPAPVTGEHGSDDLFVERRAAPRDPVAEADALAAVIDTATFVVEQAAMDGPARPPVADKVASEPRPHGAETSVRVDVGVLDNLMTLVGELVLARNQIVQHPMSSADPVLSATTQRLNLITSELQEGVMKTRMQPIGTVWSRFPRIVRDLAVTCGKQVRLEMEGTETELDRTILEAIRDPMVHLLRNSVDHGIEPVEARLAASKPAEGKLTLRSYHEGGFVNIEIADDGRGINVERVRAKAIAAEPSAARVGVLRALPDAEVINLIFEPGFSTADVVSNVSGRGVGMDVVKTHVERAGGTIEVITQAGVGTIFRIRIPLTLAIIPAVIVVCQGERYAVPQVNLVELVRLAGAGGPGAIEHVSGAPVYRLRGQLLPLVDLTAVLQGQPTTVPAPSAGAVTIVVLEADERLFGLIVDRVSGTQEIVVKPLDPVLADIAVYSGATIMGDGRVALILDAAGISRGVGMAALSSSMGTPASPPAAGAHHGHGPRGEASAGPVQALLVLSAGGRQLALPLAAVDRLEKLDRRAVERTSGSDAVQHRGNILPLFWLSDAFSGYRSEKDVLPLVVAKVAGCTVGLVADAVVEIVQAEVRLETVAAGDGLLGSAAVAGQVTELVDLAALLEARAPDLLAAVGDPQLAGLGGGLQ